MQIFLCVSTSEAEPPPLLHITTLTTAYDTIRDAILTCARKPTRVSLIYRTDPLGELRPTALPRSPRSRLTGHASKGEGSSSRPGRCNNALTRVYISGPIYKISYHQGRKFLPKKWGYHFPFPPLPSPLIPFFPSFLIPPLQKHGPLIVSYGIWGSAVGLSSPRAYSKEFFGVHNFKSSCMM